MYTSPIMTKSPAARTPNFVALIPAGGVGKRLNLGYPKQYFPLDSRRTMLEVTVSRLKDAGLFSDIVVVVAKDDAYVASCAFPEGVRVLRVAGATRAQTVRNGLFASDFADDAWVFVHDAARPCVTKEEILLLKKAVTGKPTLSGAILARPVTDTLKMLGKDKTVLKTFDRRAFYRAQTPQAFRAGLLRQALSGGLEGITDEASAVERLGGRIAVVNGKATNIKVTTAEDIAPVRQFLGVNDMTYRIGSGYDLHKTVKGSHIVLGGVRIPADFSLEAHSDGDVLAHAVIDALLGASHLGDIGRLYPDTDEAFKGADSIELLKDTVARVRQAGFAIVNVDATVIAQKPKLAPHAEAIEAKLCEALGVPAGCVSFKAKTNESLDAVGRCEAIAAQAAALLSASCIPA